MRAVIRPSYDTNRRRLADIVPLDTPFTIFIEPTRYCNFKCFYCLHSTRGDIDGAFAKTGYQIKHLDFGLYEQILQQIRKFPQRLKRIVYSGLGEPLMNPNLPKMISRARELDIADRLDVLTNAALLTPELSDALIAAGTTRIQISLQGLNSEKYQEVSKVNVDFIKLYDNIRYLYNHKGKCTVFIKIIDYLLEDENGEKRFYELFGDICDQIYIEHLITLQQQMGDHGGRADNSRNLNNEKVIFRHVCPVIFYMLQIDVDGNVFPCPVSGLPKPFAMGVFGNPKMQNFIRADFGSQTMQNKSAINTMGNIHEETIVQIWNGQRRRNLLRSHLKLNRNKIPVCSTCMACACVLDENEYLDDVAEKLLNRL